MKKSYLEELIRVITYKVLNEIQSSQFSANPKTSKDKFKLTDDDVRDTNSPENKLDNSEEGPDPSEIKRQISQTNIELESAKRELESLKAKVKNFEKVTIPELKNRKLELLKSLKEKI